MHTYDLGTLLDLDARVVFFPVRHHSPTAARLVRELVLRMKPAAILIEGPADFNDRIDELFLPHRPPLAIYSYLRLPTGQRRGAYYPLCEHSPEWQALLAGAKSVRRCASSTCTGPTSPPRTANPTTATVTPNFAVAATSPHSVSG